ncbi:hypothetical protein C8J57DRAFT_1564046 [Mycena rebaudengoi]|nr:hypothetical protein C8J57DRAFT_1564046 [Mycena rebaudengoi]
MSNRSKPRREVGSKRSHKTSDQSPAGPPKLPPINEKTSAEKAAGKCGPDCDVTAPKERRAENKQKTRTRLAEAYAQTPGNMRREEPHYSPQPPPLLVRVGWDVRAHADSKNLLVNFCAQHLSPARTPSPPRLNNPTDTDAPCTVPALRGYVAAYAAAASEENDAGGGGGIDARACVGVPAVRVCVAVCVSADLGIGVAVADGGVPGDPDADSGGNVPALPNDPALSMRATGVGGAVEVELDVKVVETVAVCARFTPGDTGDSL